MIESFLQYIRYEKNYSSYTVLSYKKDLYQFKEYTELQSGEFNPLTLTSLQFRSWVIDLMDVGYKATTVNRKISAVKNFFKFLNLRGVTSNNPTQKVNTLKTPKKIPQFFDEKDMDKCLVVSENCCNFGGVRDSLIVEMIYQTGLRRSEVATLLDLAVDVDQKQLKVLGKGNKERLVPFGVDLANKISEYRRIRDAQFGGVVVNFFLNDKGEPIKPADVYYKVKRLMGEVTTRDKRSPHVIRHTFATTMLNSGADINSIKEMLGHSSLTATQLYTHATFEEVQKKYEQAHPRANKK